MAEEKVRVRSNIRDLIEVRPDAGCKLEPFVTKNRSLFSGVGEGSLVKSTSLHTDQGETVAMRQVTVSKPKNVMCVRMLTGC